MFDELLNGESTITEEGLYNRVSEVTGIPVRRLRPETTITSSFVNEFQYKLSKSIGGENVDLGPSPTIAHVLNFLKRKSKLRGGRNERK